MADKFQLKAIISAVDKLSPTLNSIRLGLKITRKSLRDIGTAGGELMRKVGLPAIASLGAILYSAKAAALGAVEYAGSIQDAADRTGVAVEDFQALANMLVQNGGSWDDAEMAATKFNKGIAEAAAGIDKNFAGLMKKLRIPLKDAKGQLQTLSGILPDLAEAFKNTIDPALRTRMATTLFSKSGTKMIPILLKGRDGVNELRQELVRMGSIVDEQSVGSLDDLGDSVDALTVQVKSNLASAFATLLPVLQPILLSIKDWIAANKDLIRQQIVTAVTDLANALKSVDWRGAAADIRDTVKMIWGFVQAIGGLKVLFIGLGIAWLAGPLSALISIGVAVAQLIPVIASLATGFASLLLANPIILAIVAVVGALAYAVYKIYKNWDPLKGWFANLLTGMKSALSGLWDFIKMVFMNSPMGMILKAWGPVLDFFTGLFNKINAVNGVQANRAVTGSPTAARSPAVLGGSGQTRLAGELNVNFNNAPAGMRVDSGKTNQPGMNISPNVGYRSLAMGS